MATFDRTCRPESTSTSATSGGSAGGGAWSDGDLRVVLVVNQRAGRCRVGERQVVPRPALAERFPRERAGIPDDPPLDPSDSSLPQRFRKRRHRSAGRRAIPDRRVAAAAHDQVAADDPVRSERRRRANRGLEGVIPAETRRRGGDGQQLHVRRGHEQVIGVEREERRTGMVERFDADAPERAGGRGRGED